MAALASSHTFSFSGPIPSTAIAGLVLLFCLAALSAFGTYGAVGIFLYPPALAYFGTWTAVLISVVCVGATAVLFYLVVKGLATRSVFTTTYRLEESGIRIDVPSSLTASVAWNDVRSVVFRSFGPYGPAIEIEATTYPRKLSLTLYGLGILSATSSNYDEFLEARGLVERNVPCAIQRRWM